MRTVLCVQHDANDSLGVAPGALRAAGLEPVVVRAWDAAGRWPDVREHDAFVVFGGTMSSLRDDQHPYLVREREMLRRALELGIPTLGVCLGAQLLAQACGATVWLDDEPEVGFKPIELTDEGRADPTVAAFAPAGPAFEWHEDRFELPDGAALLATGERGSIQAYRIGPAVAVQFHPEVAGADIEAWIVECGDTLGSKWGREAEDFRAEVRREIDAHNEHGRAFFTAFAREALSVSASRSA